MSKRYKPIGNVRYVTRDFFTWGPRVDGHDVYIEVLDCIDTRGGRVYENGCHKVVVTGPQPRPRSKTFIGEMAWCNAERYAGDVYAELQKNQENAWRTSLTT